MLSEKEEKIVGKLYNCLDEISNKEIKLIWETGEMTVVFDTCFDDFNENDESDEFTSFVFKVSSTKGTFPAIISEDNYCIINYHNFPTRIEY